MSSEVSRILLADPEDTFRRSTARLLEEAGYCCDCAQDFQEAERLLTSRHNALLTELRLPGNMQLEFLREVRTRFPVLPIVIVTGYPSVHTAIEGIRLACADYLLKPVDWQELLQAVHRAVERARYLRVLDMARAETDRTGTSIEYVQEMMNGAGMGGDDKALAWSLDAYLSQSLGQTAVFAAGIRAVMAGVLGSGVEARPDVCRIMKCPRLDAYRQALEGTVEVLAKTKVSFRSKELALLRNKIEQLLRETA